MQFLIVCTQCITFNSQALGEAERFTSERKRDKSCCKHKSAKEWKASLGMLLAR
jgi:hypothetical protein